MDLVEDLPEVFGGVGGEEAEDEVAVLLQEGVFAAVTAPGVLVGEVLRAVEFDGEVRFGAEEVDFHRALLGEGDREFGIELEFSACGFEVLEALEEEGLCGAAGALDALGARGWFCGGFEEKSRQRFLHTVKD